MLWFRFFPIVTSYTGFLRCKTRTMAEYSLAADNASDDVHCLVTNFAQSCSTSGAEESRRDDDLLPSKVLYLDFVYLPSDFEDFEEHEEWLKGGKWLIFLDGDMQKLDMYWTRLAPLVGEKILLCLKASTGTDTDKGVLMCYTSDSKDRVEAKRAADAIRRATLDDAILYYKTNDASNQGKYRAEGDVCITKYMHTVAGSLYERDEMSRWRKVLPEPELLE